MIVSEQMFVGHRMLERLSVVMSFYNEPWEILKRSIHSTLTALDEFDELILVCDKPDRTDILKLLKVLSSSDLRLNIIVNSHNKGLVKSLNVGLSMASGSYIARMDADDVCLPNRFTLQRDFLKNNDFDLIGSLAIDFVNEQQLETISKPHSDLFVNSLNLGFNPIIHPTLFFKRDILLELGGYRNIDGCEDKDFISRAILLGFKCGNLDQPTILYRRSKDQITSRKYAQVFASGQLLKMAWRKSDGNIETYDRLSSTPTDDKSYRVGLALKHLRDKEIAKALFSSPIILTGMLGFIFSKITLKILCKWRLL